MAQRARVCAALLCADAPRRSLTAPLPLPRAHRSSLGHPPLASLPLSLSSSPPGATAHTCDASCADSSSRTLNTLRLHGKTRSKNSIDLAVQSMSLYPRITCSLVAPAAPAAAPAVACGRERARESRAGDRESRAGDRGGGEASAWQFGAHRCFVGWRLVGRNCREPILQTAQQVERLHGTSRKRSRVGIRVVGCSLLPHRERRVDLACAAPQECRGRYGAVMEPLQAAGRAGPTNAFAAFAVTPCNAL